MGSKTSIRRDGSRRGEMEDSVKWDHNDMDQELVICPSAKFL